MSGNTVTENEYIDFKFDCFSSRNIDAVLENRDYFIKLLESEEVFINDWNIYKQKWRTIRRGEAELIYRIKLEALTVVGLWE